MTPLPISTITKVFHPRIVPIPNATITELRITELFYYGLLLPNVAHSKEETQDFYKKWSHAQLPTKKNFRDARALAPL